MTLKLTTVEPIGTIAAYPFCSVDCCGGRAHFVIEGEGRAVSGPITDKTNRYFACKEEFNHLGRLVANMLSDKPGSTVSVTRASWAK